MMIQNESVAFRSDLLFVNIKPYKSHISFKTLPHIYIMTETKIDEQVKASEFLPKGYTGDIRKDRCKGGGGVMMRRSRNTIFKA